MIKRTINFQKKCNKDYFLKLKSIINDEHILGDILSKYPHLEVEWISEFPDIEWNWYFYQ